MRRTPLLLLAGLAAVCSGVLFTAPAGAETLAASGAHTCSLTAVGGVQCWGYNGSGQLGDGTTTSNATPVTVSGLGSGVVSLAAGSLHTCALTAGGGVQCWGQNLYGQLGDGTSTDRLVPTPVSGLASGVAALAAGTRHTCALTTSGAALCWGWNVYGSVGDGTTTWRLTPTPVSGLGSGVAAITAGQDFTCALTTAGAASCWGENNFGQLGDGTTTDRLVPTPVSGLGSGVVSIDASSGFHTCAVRSDGGVSCWGYNANGQLGDGTTTDRLTPTSVTGLGSGATRVVAGTYHTCALSTGGGVSCWGNNVSGQLGDGTFVQRLTPTPALGLGSGVTELSSTDGHGCAVVAAGRLLCWGGNAQGQIGDGTTTNRATRVLVIGSAVRPPTLDAGSEFACALTPLGGVECWGRNVDGQLGDGTTTDRSMPVAVEGLPSGIVAIATGGGHACALDALGGVVCWGENGFGQLGDGTTTDRLVPGPVSGLGSGVASIAAGSVHTCAVTVAGAVYCWGSNGAGQLGTGLLVDSSTPVAVSGLSSGISGITAGNLFTCAISTLGGLQCWGSNVEGQLGDGTTTDRTTPVAVTGLGSGVALATAGNWHACAMTSSGAVSCWGDNSEGQLGDGTTTDRLTPTAVVGLAADGFEIEAGGAHTCALSVSLGAQCWGMNTLGQLGDGTTTNSTTPVDVTNMSQGAAELAAGAAHTCASTRDRRVYCWGDNWVGQLGDGTTTTRSVPAQTLGAAGGARALAAGGYHSCALRAGALECWGSNASGQLGDGTTTARSAPTPVSGLGSGVASVSAGLAHTCAVLSSGALQCWGRNDYGQLGDGTTTDRTAPVVVLGSGVVAVAAGYSHTCALTTSGAALCWGWNAYGQLGDGTTTNRTTPTAVSSLGSGASALSAGAYHTCALVAGGNSACWGYNGFGQLGDGTTTDRTSSVLVTGLPLPSVQVSAGVIHTCALATDGSARCWGGNGSGQLGDGTTTSRPTPEPVSGFASGGAMWIDAGSYHTCLVSAVAGSYCFGWNSNGQLGDGTTTNHWSPVAVAGLPSGVIALASGESHSCALTDAGAVLCWGLNYDGQLGDGTTTDRLTPVLANGVMTPDQEVQFEGEAGLHLQRLGGEILIHGGGIAKVGVSPGVFPGHLNALRIQEKHRGGIWGTTTLLVTDPVMTGPNIVSVALQNAEVGTATLGPVSGGAASTSQLLARELPLKGLLRFCLFNPSCASGELEFALTAPTGVGGAVGVGVGGTLSGTAMTSTGSLPPIQYTLEAAPWTLKTVTIHDQTGATGGSTSPTPLTATHTAQGFAHGPASATSSTAAVNGVVQFVSPVQIETTIDPNNGVNFAVLGATALLRVHFVPEPGALAGLGAALAGLGLLARRRRR